MNTLIAKEENGVMQPCEPVKTKTTNVEMRLCVDYRSIKKVIVKDHFPLSLIEDQLDRLQVASIFSTIDLKNGFFHKPIAESSRKCTSFVTHRD